MISRSLLILATVLAAGLVAVLLVREHGARSQGPASEPASEPASAPISIPTPAAARVDAERAGKTSTNHEPPVAASPDGGERHRGMALEIESALASGDAGRREAAFAALLPSLLLTDPNGVAALFARQPPGEGRDLLRDEIARQWVRHERDSAIAWLKSLDDATERRAAATTAMHGIAASDPAQAVIVAEELGVGRDDGSLDRILRIWAETDPDAARRWREAQPAR